ncbi:hypothetical protein ABIE78_000288 [Sinorhizobium fredii]
MAKEAGHQRRSGLNVKNGLEVFYGTREQNPERTTTMVSKKPCVQAPLRLNTEWVSLVSAWQFVTLFRSLSMT